MAILAHLTPPRIEHLEHNPNDITIDVDPTNFK